MFKSISKFGLKRQLHDLRSKDFASHERSSRGDAILNPVKFCHYITTLSGLTGDIR